MQPLQALGQAAADPEPDLGRGGPHLPLGRQEGQVDPLGREDGQVGVAVAGVAGQVLAAAARVGRTRLIDNVIL